uniref:Tim44 domain-containing protein n=1 Tax=Ascaris lumbricoides TaxID=6252 RepID=A0A0M3IDW3_ASCLU
MLPMSRSSTFLLASLRQCRASLLSSCSTKFARAVTLQPEPEHGCNSPKKEANRQMFTLLPRRGVVIPSFDLQRRLCNMLSQFIYQRFFEKEYTLEGFLNGITEAAILCGQHISNGNWDRLGAIMNSEAVDELRERYDSLSENDKSRLRFTVDDVICSFIHSTFISGRRIFRISKPSNFAFYAIAVLYIRRDTSVNMDEAPEKLLETSPPGSIMISNVTISRPLNPLGIWKVTKINFFDYYN